MLTDDRPQLDIHVPPHKGNSYTKGPPHPQGYPRGIEIHPPIVVKAIVPEDEDFYTGYEHDGSDAPIRDEANPKTLMGNTKVPNLSVTPATALIEMARALEYGAYHAPRADGGKGYQPFNWRDKKIEYMTYIDAAVRHLLSAADREDADPDTGDLLVLHLGEAMASIAILIDAIHHNTVNDNRPTNARGLVASILRGYRKKP